MTDVTGPVPGADAEPPAESADGPPGPGRGRRHTFADLYHERTNFQFIARSWRWAVLSGVMLAISVVSLATQGLNLGIEFDGGTVWQVPVPGSEPDIDEVRSVLSDAGVGDAKVSILDPAGQGDAHQIRVQSELLEDPVSEVRAIVATAANVPRAEVVFAQGGDGSGTWTTRSDADVDPDALERAVAAATGGAQTSATADGQAIMVNVAVLPASPVQAVSDALAAYAAVDSSEVSVDTVGPTWGERVTRKAVEALVIFFVVVALYLSFRFEPKMAIAAILAVAHDIVVTAGVYSVFGFQVTPATVTAFLTILGFSLYDTVVVFDKVRENTESLLHVRKHTYSEMVNRSLNQVLMRSLSTSIVAVLPVASLLVVGAFWLGADSLADFGLALAVGLIIGTYSSLFVATPILAAWKEREPAYREVRERLDDPTHQALEQRREEKRAASTRGTDAGDQPVLEARGRRQRRRKRR